MDHHAFSRPIAALQLRSLNSRTLECARFACSLRLALGAGERALGFVP